MREAIKTGALAAIAIVGVGALVQSAAQPGAVGDPQRGAPLFSDKYNCYACHGFDAQSGERRLVPLNYTQDGFITFVQMSPLPQMPAFPDAPAQDLADIYAYIRSITPDAPAIDDVELLREIRARQREALAK